MRLWPVLAVAAVGAVLVPLQRYRDDFFVTPRSDARLGLYTADVDVSHPPEAMARLAPSAPPAASDTSIYVASTAPHSGAEGDGDSRVRKPHVVLLHCAGCDSSVWWPSASGGGMLDAPRLRKEYHVTAVDLRGHGRSARTAGPYTMALLAADVAAALRTAFPDVQQFHFLGLGVGFGVAIQTALDDPALVASVAGSGFSFDRTHAGVVGTVVQNEYFVRFWGMPVVTYIMAHLLGVPPSLLFPRYPSMKLHTHLDAHVAAHAAAADFDVRERLGELAAPVLLMIPEFDANAAVRVTRATVRDELRGRGGHVVIKEYPTYTNRMAQEAGGARLMAFDVMTFIEEHTSKHEPKPEA